MKYSERVKKFYTPEVNQLVADFPELLTDVSCGLSCPQGWVPLVRRLMEKLKDKNVHVDQIKEKFGSLRVYLSGPDANACFDLTMEASAESDRTCDECGKPGTLRSGPWIRTLCDEHEAKRREN